MKEEIKKDIHIEILKYARKKEDFTLEQLMADLKFNKYEKNLFTQKLLHENLITTSGRNVETPEGAVGQSLFCISTEGRFKLLEYEQLNEARNSSKEARWFAIFAMLLSAITGFIQIYISMCNNK